MKIFSYAALKATFFNDLSFVCFLAYVSKVSPFLNANTMFCKGSNLLHRSTLNKDLSCLGILIFFGLPTLGRFVTVLNLKNFLHTAKAAFFE